MKWKPQDRIERLRWGFGEAMRRAVSAQNKVAALAELERWAREELWRDGRRVPPERREKVLQGLLRGHPKRQVALDAGVSRKFVLRVWREQAEFEKASLNKALRDEPRVVRKEGS